MAIRPYTCKDCGHKEMFFDHETKICPKCQSMNLNREFGMPLSAKITDKVDKIHNVDMEKGIEEDLRKRNKKHMNDTIDEFIAEFGEQHAKEIGLLISTDNGRTWRKRTDFDIGLLHAQNKGTGRPG